MSQRFQFSMKALLGLGTVVCLMLGGWHLLMTYGQYVVAEPAKVGDPIIVHGRFLSLFDEEGLCSITLWAPDGRKSWGNAWGKLGSPKRSSVCTFDVTVELEAATEPGQYLIVMDRDGSGTFDPEGSRITGIANVTAD